MEMQTISRSNWYHIPAEDGREFSFREGEFFALEGIDRETRMQFRLYGRTPALMHDDVFRVLVSSGKFELITDLTIQEKEHIYNNCY